MRRRNIIIIYHHHHCYCYYYYDYYNMQMNELLCGTSFKHIFISAQIHAITRLVLRVNACSFSGLHELNNKLHPTLMPYLWAINITPFPMTFIINKKYIYIPTWWPYNYQVSLSFADTH